MTPTEQITEACLDYINFTESWLKDRDAMNTTAYEVEEFIKQASNLLLIIKLTSQNKIAMATKTPEQIFEELIHTIVRTSKGNKAFIPHVKLWAKSWRNEMVVHTKETIVRTCDNCKKETIHQSKLFNPDIPEDGQILQCIECGENTDFNLNN